MKTLDEMLSYAGALTAGLRRLKTIRVPADPFDRSGRESEYDLVFQFDREEDANLAQTGRHSLIFYLENSTKTYRVTIEPVKETH